MVWGPVLGAVVPALVGSRIKAPESMCLQLFLLLPSTEVAGTVSRNIRFENQIKQTSFCSNTEKPATKSTVPYVLFREITFLCAALTNGI